MKFRQISLIMWTLFVVTAAIYSRAAFFPFSVIDDSDYVSNNLHVTSGLSFDSLKWAITAFHAGNWHPLTWMSLMLDGQFFGGNPMGYHLVNVVLHAVNASLLFLLFRSMTGAVWRSAFVAACFALHPLHVESVAWIAERKDVLSTLFLIVTLLFYCSYVKQPKRLFYLLSLVAFSLGLIAKAMLVTIPVLLLVLDIWPFRRFNLPFFGNTHGDGIDSYNIGSGIRVQSILLEKIPFAMLSLLSAIVTLHAQKLNISNLMDLSAYARVTNAVWSTVIYIEKMLLPVNLAIFYPFIEVPLWKTSCAAAFLGATLFLAIKYRHKYPYFLAGWLWYLIALIPVIGFIQVGRQAMADRYTYIPLIGLFIVASWGGTDLCRHFNKLKKVIWIAGGGALLLCAIGTWIQLGYWRDNYSLLRHTVDVTENNSFAHDCLGLIYDLQGNPELAIAEYQKALVIEPGNAYIHYNLGVFLLDSQNRVPEAISQLEEAVALNPRLAEAHFTLGIIMDRIGKLDDALHEFKEAIKIDYNNPKYHNNLGTLYARNGMFDAAIEQFSQALQLDPRDQKAGENLQTALREKIRYSGLPGQKL